MPQRDAARDTAREHGPVYRFHGRTRPTADTRTPVRAEAPQATEENGVATLRLYDPVDSWGEFWGVSAREFAAVLDELGDGISEIRLHINSPGGEIYEGIAILNQLRNHPARVVAIVEGLAASIASVIAVGADEVIMSRNSELMIHDGWGICIGNALAMRDVADRLDRHSDNIASVYAEKAGGDVAAWRDAMLAETWYSAQEAVNAGLADSIQGTSDDETNDPGEIAPRNELDEFDLSIFQHQGRADAPAPGAPSAEPEPPVENHASTRVQLRHRMNALRKNRATA